MKKYSRIFNYLRDFKGQILLYFVCVLLSIAFSVVSLGMLAPFFDLIFKQDASKIAAHESNPVFNELNQLMTRQMNSEGVFGGTLGVLGLLCIIIIIAIFFKNFLLYLSHFILNPIKNKVVNRLRVELYNKILHLPIGFFTEKRKGDLISRITHDVNEVEMSVVS